MVVVSLFFLLGCLARGQHGAAYDNIASLLHIQYVNTYCIHTYTL